MKEIGVSTTQTQYSNINQTGIVYFGFETDGVGSVFDAEMNKMKEIHFTKSREQLELLPGKYSLVYRTNIHKKSLATISIPFEIQSGKTIPIAVK